MKSRPGQLFPPLRPESDQMLHLDVLRLIASAGIVIFHFNHPLNLDGALDWLSWTVRRWSLLVDLFFAISGYVIACVYLDAVRTWPGYVDFLRRRLARLAPLHWLTLAFFVGLALADGAGLIRDHDPVRYNMACLAPNLLLLQGFGICQQQTFNFVSWSISAEMGMYVLFPLLALILAGSRRGFVLLTAGTLTILLLCGATWHPWGQPFHMWTADFGVVRALPGFMVGLSAFAFRTELGRLPAARVWVWVLLIGFFVGAQWDVDRNLMLFEVYALALAGVAADNAAQPVQTPVRFLAPFGQLTYGLYMLHPLLLKGINLVAQHQWHLGPAQIRWLSLGLIAALVPIAYLSLIWIERPLRRRISGGQPHRDGSKNGRSPATVTRSITRTAGK
jgi:peptidoglycan/LPS O-acetylase OafA/YrhL